MCDTKSNNPPMLHAMMANGKELDIPIDLSRQTDRQFGECKLTQLLRGSSEISITVRITFKEIGTWLTEGCHQLLRLPENVTISYEIDTEDDLICSVHPSSGPVTELSINLNHTITEDIYSLLRYVGGWGKLLDAGFKIPDSSCVEFNESDGYMDLTLFGFVNKLSIGLQG